MNKPAHRGLRVPSTLLALAFLLLQGFTISNAKDPAPATGIPKTAPPSLVVAKPLCSGLTITGPSSVSRYGPATFSISNWSGQCTTWYYNGTYINSTNGSATFYFDQWTVGERTVTAIQHNDCTPSGTPLTCGIKHFVVY